MSGKGKATGHPGPLKRLVPLRARIVLGRLRRAVTGAEPPRSAAAPNPPEAGAWAEPDPSEFAGVKVRYPPGSYYSPLPDTRELERPKMIKRLWPREPPPTPGIDWRGAEQLELLRRFAERERLELAEGPSDDPTEYVTSNAYNGMFKALDAWLLEAMLRELEPARLIEVGSGFSSLIAARVNRECLGNRMDYTAIEPYPRPFLRAGVPGLTRLREQKIEDVPLEVFQELREGDVLFIDTTHAAKTGGDVPWIYGRVLPSVNPGVYVHIHDVFLPYEYPRDWVLEGWGWNEQYVVQAFLAFNEAFEVVLGAEWLLHHHQKELLAAIPGFAEYRETGHGPFWANSSGSLWIRRRA